MGLATPVGQAPALDAEELIAAARAATGLADFGPPDVGEPLAVLVDALNRESFLTPEAAAGKRLSLIRALANRLKLADAVARDPRIEIEKIETPIFIIGLPRSGTTKLHRVIAADPAMQKLPLWRLLDPISGPSPAEGASDPRIERAEDYVAAMRQGAPDAYAAHPMYADQADEEVFVMELAFLANINATAFRAPSFERWLNAQSFRPWYIWFKRLLQYIQVADNGAGRPWVLKAPHHLGFLPLLFEFFPDATVVHCHRDPLETLPSFASLALAARRSASFHADAMETGRYCLDYSAARIRTYVADRQALGLEDRFVDIGYRDIVADADRAARWAYAAAGIPFTADAARAIAGWEAENRQHRHGSHSYRLSDFGLTEAEATAAYRPYLERFASDL